MYACSPNFSEPNPLESCRTAPSGTPCCSRDDNKGWRYLLFTLGAITLTIFFVRFFVFTFRETPKFLIFRGEDAEAIEVLQHMAEVNKKPCHLTLEVFEALESEQSSIASGTSSTPALGSGVKQRDVKWSQKLKLELSRYKMLFDGFQMTRLTILVWLTYIMDFWGFTVAGKSFHGGDSMCPNGLTNRIVQVSTSLAS